MSPANKPKTSSPWLHYSDYDFRVALKIGKKELLIRCGFRQTFTRERNHSTEINQSWLYEHGLLVILGDNISKAVMSRAPVSYQMAWGWYSIFAVPFSGWLDDYREPGVTNSGISFFTLPRIKDTASLRDKVTSMIKSLESDQQTRRYVETNRRILNAFRVALRRKPWQELENKFDNVLHPTQRERYLTSIKCLRGS